MTFLRRVHLFYSSALALAATGVLLLCLLALPLSRAWLESGLTTHMLLQIPLLVLAGWLIGKGTLNQHFLSWNRTGVPGLLIAVFGILFWMIPRWLDASLSEPEWEVIKFITVPLLIGVPLGISWSRLTPFARAVVWTNSISMLVVLGWLYMAAPIRVCNNYLVNQQQDFGYTAMMLAVVIALYWVAVAFFGNWEQR